MTRRPWLCGLALALLLAPAALADSHAADHEQQAELTHSLAIRIVAPTHADILATATFAEGLTADIRSGNDLNGNDSVDALEREAFEDLMNDRLQNRPWPWNMTVDDAPVTLDPFAPYAALNIEGPVTAEQRVRLVSRANASAEATGEGDVHTWTATVDPVAAEAASTLASFTVMVPANHTIVSVEGLELIGECRGVGSGAAPWTVSFAYAEGDCTVESFLAEANRSFEVIEEEAERKEAERENETAREEGQPENETIPVDGPGDETGAEPSAPTTETEGDDSTDRSTTTDPTDDSRAGPNDTPAPGFALVVFATVAAACVLRRLG